jgi:hypothetical protein
MTRAHFKTPLARHAETRSVSEGLQSKQFQRHPSLTRRVTKGFEMRSTYPDLLRRWNTEDTLRFVFEDGPAEIPRIKWSRGK